jgi:hypothetical protein
MPTLPTYFLIAPPRNAAKFAEFPIEPLVVQSDRPAKQVIVSDGSSYGADLHHGAVD